MQKDRRRTGGEVKGMYNDTMESKKSKVREAHIYYSGTFHDRHSSYVTNTTTTVHTQRAQHTIEASGNAACMYTYK